jgi:WD40 repeat protein
VYPAGAVAVVCSPDPQGLTAQRFFCGHSYEIASLAVHPDGVTVATGEDAAEPSVLVWGSEPRKMVTLAPPIRGHHRRGVAALAFSRDGRFIISVGREPNHLVAVCDWRLGTVVCSQRTGERSVIALRTCPHDGSFVTAGEHTLRFWSIEMGVGTEAVAGSAPMSVWKHQLRSKRGVFGRHGAGVSRTLLCIDFAGPGITLTGAKDGNLLLWKGSMLTAVISAHQGPLIAIWSIPADGVSMVVTGGKDGTLMRWTLDVSARMTGARLDLEKGAVRAVCWQDDFFLVGTAQSEVLVVPATAGPDLAGAFTVTVGHARKGLRALSVNPRKPWVAIGGGDGMVMLFDTALARKIGAIQMPRGVTALDFSPDGTRLACGMDLGGGVVLMYKERAGLVATSYTWGQGFKGPITLLRYAPSGGLVAQATQNKVDVLNAQNLKNKVGSCLGHAGDVKHLDWSSDSKLLATCSDAYELLFWDTKACTPVLASSVASYFDRTVTPHWASWTCNLGWPVLGVIDASQDELRVQTLASRAGTDVEPLIATGEADGSVRLFCYPAAQHHAEARVARARHVGPISHVAFLPDDRLLSTGRLDHCLFQYRLVPAAARRERDAGGQEVHAPRRSKALERLVRAMGPAPRELQMRVSAASEVEEGEADEFESVKVCSALPPTLAQTPPALSCAHAHLRVEGGVADASERAGRPILWPSVRRRSPHPAGRRRATGACGSCTSRGSLACSGAAARYCLPPGRWRTRPRRS